MTEEQLDNWFSYHSPTEETAPKYAAIRAAEEVARHRIVQTDIEVGPDTKQLHEEINVAMRQFAKVIDANAPDSADKTAAIRCVRLARNLFNEWAILRGQPPAQWRYHPDAVWSAAVMELLKARMQANSAIACGGR